MSSEGASRQMVPRTTNQNAMGSCSFFSSKTDFMWKRGGDTETAVGNIEGLFSEKGCCLEG